MGYRFTLTLSREITDDESGLLQSDGATITSVSFPEESDSLVSQIDFDTEAAPSLAEAIESALAAVKQVPDLTVPVLTVPPHVAEEASAE
jgi:hypothetical protein